MAKRTFSSEFVTAVRVLAVGYLLLLGAAGIRVFFAGFGLLSTADMENILWMPCVLCVFLFILLPVMAAREKAAPLLKGRGKGALLRLCLFTALFPVLHSGAAYFFASLAQPFSLGWYRILALYPIPLMLWRAVRTVRSSSAPRQRSRSRTEDAARMDFLSEEVTAQFAQFADRGLTNGMYVYTVQADLPRENYSASKNEEELARARAHLLPILKARGFQNVRIELKETEYEHIFVPDAQVELPTILGMAEDSDGKKNIVQGTVTTYYEPKPEMRYSADIVIYAEWSAKK